MLELNDPNLSNFVKGLHHIDFMVNNTNGLRVIVSDLMIVNSGVFRLIISDFMVFLSIILSYFKMFNIISDLIVSKSDILSYLKMFNIISDLVTFGQNLAYGPPSLVSGQ